MTPENDKSPNEKISCPHCGQKLSRWQAADQNPWGDTVHLVCFNDECPYFVRGWKWMNEKYGVGASYRFRYNPDTGEKGPLPVFSDTALRSGILDNDNDAQDDNGEGKEST